MGNLEDFKSKLGYWFTDGDSKGMSTSKTILLGLSIIVPIFLVMIAPFLGWISISPEHRYDVQYNWLQDFMLIWPLSIFGVIFIAVLSYIIYNNVKSQG